MYLPVVYGSGRVSLGADVLTQRFVGDCGELASRTTEGKQTTDSYNKIKFKKNTFSPPCIGCGDNTTNPKNYNFFDCDWFKNYYFPLIHLTSCYRTVCYWTVCYRTVQ